MRKKMIIIVIFLAVGVLSYLVIYSVLIPKTATLSIPFKWRTIPLRQSKNLSHLYLGAPASGDSSQVTSHEIWYQGAKDKMYRLQINFSDSIVTGYSIRYLFSNDLFSRNYLLDTVSIK